MDPDHTLQDLRVAVALYRVNADIENSQQAAGVADFSIDLFEALDEWLSNGGFLPKAWQTRNTNEGEPQ